MTICIAQLDNRSQFWLQQNRNRPDRSAPCILHRRSRQYGVNFRVLAAFCAVSVALSSFAQSFSLKDYRDFAMSHEGDIARGNTIFNDETHAVCVKCHTTDGSAGKAGPDLLAIGDKFPRRDLIQAILEPSAAIAVGYGATTIETKDGEEVAGIIKQATDDFVDLMTAEGRHVRIAAKDIKQQQIGRAHV